MGLGIAIVAALALNGSAAPRFEVEHLAVDGDVQHVDAADLDGDGKLDLVVPVLKGTAPHIARSLAIFWNRGGSFAAAPDLVLPMDGDVCAFDLGDVDGAPGVELLAITPSGVEARSFADRKAGPWRKLIAHPTLFARAPKDELPRFHLVQPLGPKGAELLVVPELGQLAIYARVGDAWTLRSEVAVDVDASLDVPRRDDGDPRRSGMPSFGTSVRFPALYVSDSDGDGLPDLYLARHDRVAIHRQRADGTFPAAPDYAREFEVRTEKEQRESYADVRVNIADIDGDGRADAILTEQVSEGISSAETTVYVFFGTPGGFPDKPDQTLKTSGASFAGTQLADLTGDGKPDLLLPSVHIGLMAIIRILTTKNLTVEFQLHPFEGKRFAAKPTVERSLTFHLDLGGHTDLQAVSMYGDYDGDGRLDLAFGTDEEELSIFPGGGEELFAKDAAVEIPVRAYGQIRPVDLDGQKRDDLLLWYPGTRGHRQELSVVHNRGLPR